jgi:hypothetical protein
VRHYAGKEIRALLARRPEQITVSLQALRVTNGV